MQNTFQFVVLITQARYLMNNECLQMMTYQGIVAAQRVFSTVVKSAWDCALMA